MFVSKQNNGERFLMSAKKDKSLKYFEPTKPIETAKDFTEELLQYKEDEGNDLFILEEGLEPLVEIDGKKYRCFLEHPRMIQRPRQHRL